MERPGLQVSGLRGSLDAEALAKRQVKLRLTNGLLQVSDGGLRWLLPPGVPIKIERISGGHLFVQVRQRVLFADVTASIEFRPSASAEGRIRLEPVSLKAAGLVLPAATVGMILGAVRGQVAGKPGVHLAAGNVLEIDLGEILWHVANVEFPPLKSVRAGEGTAELEF